MKGKLGFMGDTKSKMRKEFITRDDGRYIIFYYFENELNSASADNRQTSSSEEEESDV